MDHLPDGAWDRINALLDAAWDLDPEERSAYLDEACAGEPELREHVEALLKAEAEAPDFLEDGATSLAAEALADVAAVEEGPTNRRVGPYRLVEEIGHGGMSRVYRAERADGAFEREVAVKLLRMGLNTSAARQRFRLERHVLATLDHPDIARLLDGGLTDEGVPYLVMEYVEGQPITDYCDERRLSVQERLQLLATVSEALQYAHRNLVVHRDLKPSNILVTGDGRVKLLDFGIAKLLDADDAPLTVPATRTGVRPMTPAYAAPEQVAGEAVSTATDIYQLGVLAYELLTGHRPYRSLERPTYEVQQAVLTEEPAPPSTIVTEVERHTTGTATIEIAPEAVSRVRGTSPSELKSTLRGDLNAVVLKALRKDPEQRYASAEAFATDIGHYLSGRPVDARSLTTGYRTRKFVRRHRTGVAMAAGVVALVVIFIGTLLRQQNETARERDRAQAEAQKAEEVSSFLVSLFEASDPYESAGDTTTARELLQYGTQRVEQLGEQPVVQAQMLDAMGRAHLGMGHYEEADSLLRRALALRRQLHEAPHPDVAASLSDLATVVDEQGQYAAAESLAHEALTMRRRIYGETHPDEAVSLNDVALYKKRQGEYAPAESLYREALSMQRHVFDEPNREMAATMNNLGQVLTERGDYAVAESLHRETLALRKALLGEAHPETAESLNNLAQAVERQGHLAKAESLYRETLALDRRLFGSEHTEVAVDLSNLAVVLERQGHLAEAESLKRQSLAMRRKLLGDEHPDLTTSMNNLAVLLRKKREYDDAASLFTTVLTRLRKQFGDEHPYIAFTTGNLGDTRLEQGRLAAADSLYQATLGMITNLFGDQHPHAATTLDDLADVREKQGRRSSAARLHQEALAIRREALGEAHPKTAESLGDWADVLMQQNELERADSLYREALAINEEVLPADDWRTAWDRGKLGACLVEQGRYAAAEPLLQTSLDVLAQQRGTTDEYTQTAMGRLAELYEASGKPERARTWRDSLVTLRELDRSGPRS